MMTLRELAREFRRRHGDEVQPYLWTDPEILNWVNEAQEMFCRLTDGIPDMMEIPVTAGEAFSPYPPYIKTFRRAWDEQGRELYVLNEEDMGRKFGVSAMSSQPGPVKGMVLGLRANQIRWWMVPVEDASIRVHVFRLPREPLCRPDEYPEIPPQYHLLLLDWVSYRAHQKQDAETFDRGRSAEAYDRFNDQCRQAHSEQDKLRYRPSLITYGGL